MAPAHLAAQVRLQGLRQEEEAAARQAIPAAETPAEAAPAARALPAEAAESLETRSDLLGAAAETEGVAPMQQPAAEPREEMLAQALPAGMAAMQRAEGAAEVERLVAELMEAAEVDSSISVRLLKADR
jgi:hypothetical protein